MKINESAENYLKTILVLQERNGYVRNIDIANELSFSKPSVSIAMKSLKENGYILISDDGLISLTKKGSEIAERVFEINQLIFSALVSIGVDEDTALIDSCKIEHCISEKSLEKIKKELKGLNKLPSRSGDIDVVLL